VTVLEQSYLGRWAGTLSKALRHVTPRQKQLIFSDMFISKVFWRFAEG